MAAVTTSDAVSRYNKVVAKAIEYHKKALWQEKLQLLQEALILCDEPGFPDAAIRRQEHLFDLGCLWRRLGQYEKAQGALSEALSADETDSLVRANIMGELGVLLRHGTSFHEAARVFEEQYELADYARPSLERDIQLCRAIGNLGMCTYQLYKLIRPADPHNLRVAMEQLRERIERARSLQQRLLFEHPESKYVYMAKIWEGVGLDRLSLCLIDAGEPQEAIRATQERLRIIQGSDPSALAFSRFFSGNALWANGERAAALAQWNAPNGSCSSPMVFCKEPSAEHTEYIKLMASAGVEFDADDEQGYSALDYAVLADNSDATGVIEVVKSAIRTKLLERVPPDLVSDREKSKWLDDEIATRMHEALLHQQYRTIFQEHIRPLLRKDDSFSFAKLRNIYPQFLKDNSNHQRLFSPFQYLKYLDFKKYRELPISSAGLTKTSSVDSPQADDFVIFISYRWVGESVPDDADKSQWRRIVDVVEKFLIANPDVRSERLGLWLDYACIDQENEQERLRGVDALLLAVTLCNAMISLVDDLYYTRAWCGVEVMLIGALVQYDRHQWWESTIDCPGPDTMGGTLKRATPPSDLSVSDLNLTKEKLDRPKIDFLLKQSKLLGKVDV